MKAIVQTEYGSADVLKLREVDRPTITDSQLLIRVHATSVHAGDRHLMHGTPWLLRLIFGGIFKPKIQILGTDIAGTVEAIGLAVTQFKIGDQIFGDLSECGFGGFAEYVAAPEKAFILKPYNLTFEEAATVPVSALAALQGLCKLGQIQSGQNVLINGASGGVGTYAIQIAKANGAEVTALCHTRNIEVMRSIGADHIIAYDQIDITKTSQQYDLIFDAAAYRSVFDYLPILKSKGTYVIVGGSIARLFQIMLFGSLVSKWTGRKLCALSSTPNQTDLTTLKDLLEAEKIVPIIDRHYTLNEVPEAIRRLEDHQVIGKISIQVMPS